MPKFNKNQYSLKEAYAFYKKSVENPVSYEEYKLILDTWGNKVVEYLLEGKDVKLHAGMSLLGVRKRHKPTFVDRQESKKQGQLVKSSNIHSGFFGAYVYWRRRYTRFNSVGWIFVATRKLHRALGTVMLQPDGHRRFTMKAEVARSEVQAKSMFNKKVHGL